MLKQIIVSIAIFCLLCPTNISAGSATIVINRFQISGATANDEFVELMNIGSASINLSGWQLGKYSSSGASANLVTVFPDFDLKPSATIIVAHPDFKGTADINYSSKGYYLSANSAIVLRGPDNGGNRETVDLVGFGESPVFEVSPVAGPNQSEIFSRRNGQDTDNNAADFYLAYTPPVEEEESPEEPEQPVEETTKSEATVGAKIRVNEFMSNPEGSDTEGEWIEIYNSGADANVSGYIITDTVGSPKKYKLPEGTIIKAGQYLAFYSSKTPISLNNDDEGVQILDPSGKVISASTNSGKGQEGASFAYDGSSWSWTTKPTPGAKNIIEKPSGNEKSDKESKEVLSLVDDKSLPAIEQGNISETEASNDRLLGYSLIALAILGAISYTLYINKEKIREAYYKIRKRNNPLGQKIRSGSKGR